VVWAQSRQAAERFERTARRFDARVELVERDDSWQTEWTRHLVSERVTDGFVLQPVADDTPAPAGTQRLWFRPELAFGVGSHPTTRLAARSVQRLCRARPGLTALDVGSGTGVLAFIAVLSGARDCLGIDIDPVAVRAAAENARLNELAERTRFEVTPLAEISDRHDLVVANLEAPVQLELARDLSRVVETGGVLVATGFLMERRDEIGAALGLAVDREDSESGWSLLELRPR
jgi:ribosomal protein L11 methyltransferase